MTAQRQSDASSCEARRSQGAAGEQLGAPIYNPKLLRSVWFVSLCHIELLFLNNSHMLRNKNELYSWGCSDTALSFQGRHKLQNLSQTGNFSRIIHRHHPSLTAELILGEYSQWHPRMIMQTRDLDISQKQEHTKSWHPSFYIHVSPTCHRVFFFGDSSSFWSSITDVFWKRRTNITSAFYSVIIYCSTSITKEQIN